MRRTPYGLIYVCLSLLSSLLEHIIKAALVRIAATMSMDYIVATVTLDTIGTVDTIVEFVVSLVVLLASSLLM
jgi:hypothetical protein